MPRLNPEIYKVLIFDKRLSHGAFRLWHYLHNRCGNKSYCWPGVLLIRKELRCNYPKFKEWLENLVTLGYLKVSKRKRQTLYEPHVWTPEVIQVCTTLSFRYGQNRGVKKGNGMDNVGQRMNRMKFRMKQAVATGCEPSPAPPANGQQVSMPRETSKDRPVAVADWQSFHKESGL